MFLKNSTVQKEWIKKCKRGDSWNPNKSYICSNHFDNKDFVHDFKVDLLGTKSNRRFLPGVVLSLNLASDNRPSVSAVNRKNK